MNATEIAQAIVSGDFNVTELNQLITAINTAQRLTRAKRSAVAMTQVRVGSVGTTVGMRPAHNGKRVRVLEIKRSRIEVQELDAVNAWSGRYTIPAQCIALD